MTSLVRVGIVADTPLQRHMLSTVIAEQGYDVAVSVGPDTLNPSLLGSDTISMWVVDLQMEDQWSDFLDELLELESASIIIGDGIAPSRNSQDFPNWKKRLINKLKDTQAPTGNGKAVPVFDLSKLQELAKPQEDTIELPSVFHYANPTQVDHVWVIGSSLGGPEPVKAFFDALPAGLPAAFIYAQHIDEGCLDTLVSSIGRHTELTMTLAKPGAQLENGHILVSPVSNEIDFHANNSVMMKDNEWSGPYGPSIDQLIENVARRYKTQANAIIFSGMGSDGALGATIIKQMGGKVWCQSEETSAQPSMPNSAYDTGCVSYRGAPRELAKQLVMHLVSQNKGYQETETQQVSSSGDVT